MKVYVNVSSMTSEGEYLEAGSTPDIDKKKEQKLFDLGNVEPYDEKKHGVVKVQGADAELVKANEQLAADKAILEAKVAELHGFVEQAIGLAKGTTPDGYVKD